LKQIIHLDKQLEEDIIHLENNCDNDEFLLLKASDLTFVKSDETDSLITRQGAYVITEQGVYG
jgi:hypothetical protein